MESSEVARLSVVEDDHWWFRERRHLLHRAQQQLHPTGVALDIGSGGGGNTRVLAAAGWRAVAMEYDKVGAEISRGRGIATARGDGTRLPIRTASVDLVVAFDVLEHIPDDAAAAAEMCRVLRPTGTLLLAVPADPRLWSAHDVAVDHVRRYTRESLTQVLRGGGFRIQEMRGWNVLMKPAAKFRRQRATGSEIEEVPALLNSILSAVIKVERHLPVSRFTGVSLLVRAQPARP